MRRHVTFYLKITDQEVIEKASFEATDARQHRHKQYRNRNGQRPNPQSRMARYYLQKVTQEVGGLPSIKFHCGVLAVGALKRAVRLYFEKKGTTPELLPKEHTFEEKQALEEEELAKTLSKRLKTEEEKK
jgi:nitrogen fixation NifU-like protein